jgi:valyl-tRNA synthetase
MERMETSRNFANKLWNMGRYLVHKIAKDFSPEQRQAFAVNGPILKEELDQLRLPERYIVTRCHQVINRSTASLDNCDISDVGLSAYQLLYDVADWYIEASKTRKDDDLASARVLVYVFDSCLRLLHPYMPFVTETLWQELPIHDSQCIAGKSLMVAPWPLMEGDPALSLDHTALAHFESFMDLAKAVRNARVEHDVDLRKKVSATLYIEDIELMKSLIEEKEALALLGRMDINELHIESQCPLQENKNVVRLVVREGLMVDIPLKNLVDAEKERLRLSKQAVKLEKELGGV